MTTSGGSLDPEDDALRATRRILREASGDEVRPPRDLAGEAMRRLRARDGAISNVNELLHAVRSLIRGIATLFSDPGDERPSRG